jgi:hypothetical protein
LAKNLRLKELKEEKEVEEAKDRKADRTQRSPSEQRTNGEEKGRKYEAANTKKYSRKYTPCQLPYWYRSNDLWKRSARMREHHASGRFTTAAVGQNP